MCFRNEKSMRYIKILVSSDSHARSEFISFFLSLSLSFTFLLICLLLTKNLYIILMCSIFMHVKCHISFKIECSNLMYVFSRFNNDRKQFKASAIGPFYCIQKGPTTKFIFPPTLKIELRWIGMLLIFESKLSQKCTFRIRSKT